MEFTVKRSGWLRGEGGHPSLLFRPKDQKRCCIGFYLKACGLSDSSLEDKPSPYDIPRVETALPAAATWLLEHGNGNTSLSSEANSEYCIELMRVNDARLASAPDRERRIIELFAQRGIIVKFVD